MGLWGGFSMVWKTFFHTMEKGVKSFRTCGKLIPHDERTIYMSKGMIWGLLILAIFVVILIMTQGRVEVNLLSMEMKMKTSYALLAAAGVGVVAGALLRK